MMGRMAAFDLDALTTHPLDFQLWGAPVLFWSRDVLRETTDWLTEHTYKVVTLSASRWGEASRMHDDIAAALGFPSYYGRNLDALNECMWDVACGAYGSPLSATGLVLVLTEFDQFARDDHATALKVLDIFGGQAMTGMKFGRRVLFLVQSDDPDLVLGPIGAMPVLWNGREYLNSTRHP